MHDLGGQRVTVMGLGRFGGGVGVTRWLCAQGARVLVTDLARADDLSDALVQIEDLVESGAVQLHLGGHDVTDFARADLVIANPAVPKPWANPYLEAARHAGVPITTEMAFLVEHLPNPDRFIAVTGTAGKSTTAALCAHILSQCNQPVVLGGNIGGSLLGQLDAINESTWVVLEVSSAMLWWLDQIAPRVAIVTNFAPNHLDWHGSLEQPHQQRRGHGTSGVGHHGPLRPQAVGATGGLSASDSVCAKPGTGRQAASGTGDGVLGLALDDYRRCKQRLLSNQRPGAIAVLTPSLGDWPTAPGVHRIVIGDDDAISGLAIPGAHNALNAAQAVAAIAAATDIDHDALTNAARSFTGLPHRLQLIEPKAPVRCYDDSKATTPEATRLAVEAFEPTPGASRIHLIVGGYDKGVDLNPIAALANRLAGLYTIGATGSLIAQLARDHNAHCCADLDRAIALIARRTKPGDIILLSPGCASWDQFPNYEVRGDRFARLVRDEINR